MLVTYKVVGIPLDRIQGIEIARKYCLRVSQAICRKKRMRKFKENVCRKVKSRQIVLIFREEKSHEYEVRLNGETGWS